MQTQTLNGRVAKLAAGGVYGVLLAMYWPQEQAQAEADEILSELGELR